MAADRILIEEVLALIPQQSPFRFIDDILEIDDDHIVGTYRFHEDEFFYRGHFPGNPVTPGVILIETMAQTGVVALGLYLLLREGKTTEEINSYMTLFATVDGVEFTGMISPGEKVIVRGEKVYFRRRNLKTKVRIEREDGELVSCGVLTGRGVIIDE